MATIQSNQHRANELANNLKFDAEVKNNRNEMNFTNISSALSLEPLQGNLAKASESLKSAADNLSNGVKGVAVAIAEADRNVANLIYAGSLFK